MPGSVVVVCNDSANSAKPVALLIGLPMWLCADGSDIVTLAQSNCVHESYTAADHAAIHAQSLSEQVSIAQAHDLCVALQRSVPAQDLVLVLDIPFSNVEWYASSYPGVPQHHSLCSSHATKATLERASLDEHSHSFVQSHATSSKHGMSV